MGKKKATQLAFSGILERLHAEDAESAVAWEQVAQDAQAGDALIKLAAYLNPELKTAEQSSHWLQEQESDAHLVGIYDRLEAQGEPSLERWGRHLSVKRKATLVEALIWRRFGSAVLAPGARAALGDIVTLLAQG